MGDILLNKLCESGIPLIEIVVRFKDGVDYEEATKKFNSLGEDIHLHSGDWYNQPNLRVGDASAESLFRLFDWKFHRIPLILQNEETGKFEDSDYFCWEDLKPKNVMPAIMQGIVENISYSQPGSNDQGQWYEPKFA